MLVSVISTILVALFHAYGDFITDTVDELATAVDAGCRK